MMDDPGDTLPADQTALRAVRPPRGVEDRIAWFLSNDPGGVGW